MPLIDSVTLQPGRHFLVRLPAGQDLMDAIEAFCRQEAVAWAVFRAAGTLSSVTVGAYDQHQQVFATHRVEGDLDIAVCDGTVSITKANGVSDGRIVVSDLQGVLTGGRLFGPSVVHAAEALLIEYAGPVPERFIDPVSGRCVWTLPASRPSSSIVP